MFYLVFICFFVSILIEIIALLVKKFKYTMPLSISVTLLVLAFLFAYSVYEIAQRLN